ncbi:MAG: aldolase catalytic domain-containing protein [Verrucomicrobiales bacterium]|jgi:4-hydroxy 2-oxovalerate aldolase|nr:aldolase catalytic domain-containing protein [Verrucomicrobiales bacterium]MBP9226294.1 aldolase catalytic domain-containing protein [Verrucomicrobiales bacterium]
MSHCPPPPVKPIKEDVLRSDLSFPQAVDTPEPPAVHVLDCTIRDGGLMNCHHFEDRVVSAVHAACAEAGINYMEIGYRASRKDIATGQHGCWKYCLEEDIRRIVGDRGEGPKLSIMADVGKCDFREDIPQRRESIVDLVRVACYTHQIPLALEMVKDARDKGYETTLNLMAVTTVHESELDEALSLLASSEADAVYVVDSFGALYMTETRRLVEKYLAAVSSAGIQVGIHAHNNLQLAFANTIEAYVAGATWLDATMAGLGRGAGNCPMELLLGFLGDSDYRLRPVLRCVDRIIEPTRTELKWGFDLPYMITGLYNLHPRSAIAFNAAEVRDDIGAFYESSAAEGDPSLDGAVFTTGKQTV